MIRSRTRLEMPTSQTPSHIPSNTLRPGDELLVIRILDNFKICSIDALVAIIVVFARFIGRKKGGFPTVLRSLPYSMTCSYFSSVAGGTPRYEDAIDQAQQLVQG